MFSIEPRHDGCVLANEVANHVVIVEESISIDKPFHTSSKQNNVNENETYCEFPNDFLMCVQAWMGKIGADVEHRMPFLPVFPKACGEFHTR